MTCRFCSRELLILQSLDIGSRHVSTNFQQLQSTKKLWWWAEAWKRAMNKAFQRLIFTTKGYDYWRGGLEVQVLGMHGSHWNASIHLCVREVVPK